MFTLSRLLSVSVLARFRDDTVVDHADVRAMLTRTRTVSRSQTSLLPDAAQMDGNCALAQAGVGKNEYYPCIPSTQDYGVAIVGNLDEAGRNPLSNRESARDH